MLGSKAQLKHADCSSPQFTVQRNLALYPTDLDTWNRYASTIDVSFAEEDSRKTAESKHCKREQERLELVARLASLAATAEHRTRGSVVLRRLPSTHPQHSRCLRAATDNVKTGFFTPNSPYGAVRVLDVYKVGNPEQTLSNFPAECRKGDNFPCTPLVWGMY